MNAPLREDGSTGWSSKVRVSGKREAQAVHSLKTRIGTEKHV